MPDTPEAGPCPAEVVAFLRGLGLPEAAWSRVGVLERLAARLAAANREMNLTRICDGRDFWVKHVADSLAVAVAEPALLAGSATVADVGPGAGFPLFPLAWANPALRLTGIECSARKATYLAETAALLEFANCRIVARQAREAGRDPGEAGRHHIVVARAVGEAPRLVRECRLLLAAHAGARLILYSTPVAAGRDQAAFSREAQKFGLCPRLSATVELPFASGRRQFLVAERT
jgi:16S rRNA (guanine527-N7)-methyltransferase